LGEEKLANVMECKAGLFHGVGDRHSLEIASMMNLPGFAVDERVIRSWTPLVREMVLGSTKTYLNYTRLSQSSERKEHPQFADPRTGEPFVEDTDPGGGYLRLPQSLPPAPLIEQTCCSREDSRLNERIRSEGIVSSYTYPWKSGAVTYLTRVRTGDIMNESVKGATRSHQSLRAHSCADLGKKCKVYGIVESESCDGS
jgi:hypothetical protein